MESLCVKDRSYVLSPTSTTSSSGEVEMTSAFEIQRSKLNAFLGECEIHPPEKPWLEWANVGERTGTPGYIQRTNSWVKLAEQFPLHWRKAHRLEGVCFGKGKIAGVNNNSRFVGLL